MEKIIVVSDSHGKRKVLEDIVSMNPDATCFLHAGDSMMTESSIFPYLTVSGNCDFFIKNKTLLLDIKGVKILMFHGHRRLLTDDALVLEAKKNNANIVIHGHTHSRKNKCIDNVHLLCPGSTTYSRSGLESYAVITYTSVEDIAIQIIDL